jgi:hypothetical protein
MFAVRLHAVMQDRPTSSELLDAVRRFLESDAVPALDGTKKFHARVAANVLAIVLRERELELPHVTAEWQRLDTLVGVEPMPASLDVVKTALTSRTERLCERIRNGEADYGSFRRAVLDHARQTVIEKLAIDNPKLVADRPSRSPRDAGFGFVSVLMALLIAAALYFGYFKMQDTRSGSGTRITALDASRDVACRSNRQTIERALVMWSASHDEGTPSLESLARDGIGVPSCPEGGTYTLAGSTVHCSKHR